MARGKVQIEARTQRERSPGKDGAPRGLGEDEVRGQQRGLKNAVEEADDVDASLGRRPNLVDHCVARDRGTYEGFVRGYCLSKLARSCHRPGHELHSSGAWP
jgi:hypothetical protein